MNYRRFARAAVRAGAALSVATLGVAALACADQPYTAERVFSAPDLGGPLARGATPSPDGRRIAFLQPRTDDRTRLDLWVMDAAGARPARRLVDARALEADVAVDPDDRGRRERQRVADSGVVEYAWRPDGEQLLVPLAGQLYVVDAEHDVTALRVARDPVRGAPTDSRFSPRGRWIGFVAKGRLYVTPADGGDVRPVSPSADGAVRYAVAEFVAQEEMARDTGYWWSPDDTAIAYTQVDEADVSLARRVEIPAGGEAVDLVEQRFPRAGTANARVALRVQRLDGGPAVDVDLGADPDVYVARVAWSTDAHVLYVQRQSRDQQTLDLLAVDPTTGRSRVLVSDHWSPWVNLTNGFTPLHDGTFLWESERSGFRHLYLYRPDGTLARVVTSGAFPLAGVDRLPSVVGVDERRGEVYVMASIHSPLEQHLYVTSYRHASPLRRVSREPGWWSARMSAAANVYVGTHSRYDTPPRTAVYAADGTLRRWLVENPLDASHPYFPYRGGLPRPEFGELRAEDGQTLHYVLMKPTAFDPRRRYPAIVQVYGGPGRQKVTSAWRSPSERLYLEAGFVVFQLDNRGSSNRGLRFEAPISRALGGAEVRDQLVGLKFLRSQSYVDGNRIGVSGWSYGGYMTLRMMTEPGADIAAGIAGAPVSLWRLYDTHYTERFLGRPQDDPGAYASASIVPRLARLQGRLLYAHGMSDDNVLLENGTAIIGALQRLGTTFDLMLYPGERHGINDPALQLHLWRTSIEFFRRTLGGPVDAPRAASEPPTP